MPIRTQTQSVPSNDGQFGNGRGVQFLILFALLGLSAPFLVRMSWHATPELHTLLEVVAALLAGIVAHLTLIYHRHSRRDAQFFFVAFAFLSAFFLDLVHLLVTLPNSVFFLSSPEDTVTPWSWLLSRLALAGFLLFNAATLSADRSQDTISRGRIRQYLLFIVVLGVTAFLVLLLVPLPKAIFLGLLIPRPQELIVAIPFGLAFVLYYRKRAQVQDPLFRWILASIVFNLAIQLFFIPWSHTLFDAAFNWAHLAKIASYSVVLFGLAHSMTDVIDQLRHNRDEIRGQNTQLSLEVIERKKAEQTIRIYQDIVNNMHSGVYVIKQDDPADLGSFRFIFGNQGAERATGQPVEPVLNQRIDQAAPELMATEFPGLYRKVLETQEPLNLGDIHVPGLGDRDESYFSVWLVPLDESHLASIFENISERKVVEERLRSSQTQLSEAQALAQLGSWNWNITAGSLTWSDELFHIYGYEPGEVDLTFDLYFGHIHPEDRELVQRTLDQALADGERFDYYHRIVAANGDIRILQARGQVETEMVEGESRPALMWGTGQDVTDRRLLEEARRRNEIKLAQALTLSRMGHWDWNLATNQVDISAELAPIFGLGTQPIRISFEAFIALIHADDRNSVRDAVHGALEMRSRLHTKFRVIHPDGTERGVEGIGTVVLNSSDEPEHLWGTGQDITERLRLESQLKSYAVQLESSNRDLQEFAYIASHDLQEPLRKILAFGNRLAQVNKGNLDEKSVDYLNRMQDAAQRMQTLINDLLTLSRVSTKRQPMTRIDLNGKVENVLRDLETQIERTGGLVEVGELPTIKADRVQLQQLFQNLISNSLKFHRADERPVVRIYAPQTESSIESGKEPIVTVVIQDNGIGFDEKYRDKIFQPFQRLHGRNSYEGTGMGLAICRKIMERHGGSLTAESIVGQGTKFILRFPQTEQESEAESEIEPRELASPR